MTRTALIAGAGSGISASFARALQHEGYQIALAARRVEDLSALASETSALVMPCDVTDPAQVQALFAHLDRAFGRIDVVLYNASSRTHGPFTDIDRGDALQALMTGAYGGFLVAQEAARRMLKQGSGTLLFTGASASVKGYARSAPFAMGKFALRGLAQSLARELHPQGIHVAHFVIDGIVRNEAKGQRDADPEAPSTMLDPDAIAQTYMHVLNQPRSAWTWEVELRPWVEKF